MAAEGGCKHSSFFKAYLELVSAVETRKRARRPYTLFYLCLFLSHISSLIGKEEGKRTRFTHTNNGKKLRSCAFTLWKTWLEKRHLFRTSLKLIKEISRDFFPILVFFSFVFFWSKEFFFVSFHSLLKES